ncbi:MAG: DUF559 domain-containing protein [Alloprevotella sp.]|nr:DUF559 domain-containing protein [Alloprevotella sp.]
MRQHYETGSKIDYELLRQHARNLRSCPTEAERTLWNLLKENKRGLRFRCYHIILDYIVDFVCLRAKLIVELDGVITLHYNSNKRTRKEPPTLLPKVLR